MKRFIVIVLAVLMLGLAVPKQSEAGDEWVPLAIVGGIIMGTVIAEATDPCCAYVYNAPPPIRVYYPPGPVYVYTRHMNPPHYRYVPQKRHGHWDYRRHQIPPHHRQDHRHR